MKLEITGKSNLETWKGTPEVLWQPRVAIISLAREVGTPGIADMVLGLVPFTLQAT